MLEGKRIAILAEEGFDDIELTEPLRVLRNAGAGVVVVGSGGQGIYHGKKGTATIQVDTDAQNARAEDFDAVVVPGGYAPGRMSLHPATVDFVRGAHDSGRIIAAICHGPLLLMAVGIVGGRRMTSWPTLAADLRAAGAIWTYEPVVRDGNIITSRKPADLPQFDRAIIRAVAESGAARGGAAVAQPARQEAARSRTQ